MMRTRVGAVVVVVGLAAVVMTGSTASAGDKKTRAALQDGIEADVASLDTVPGEILTVRAPGIDQTVATGFADVDAQTPLEPDTPFRVASMTKTFVAAAVLRLVEEGKVNLDDPITDYLSAESLDVLRADGYDVDQITVRQLLQHTSGLIRSASPARSSTTPTPATSSSASCSSA
jgi:D-alanyl-D-alanine carboxypeptidase